MVGYGMAWDGMLAEGSAACYNYVCSLVTVGGDFGFYVLPRLHVTTSRDWQLHPIDCSAWV